MSSQQYKDLYSLNPTQISNGVAHLFPKDISSTKINKQIVVGAATNLPRAEQIYIHSIKQTYTLLNKKIP